jgi:hypothetical protein
MTPFFVTILLHFWVEFKKKWRPRVRKTKGHFYLLNPQPSRGLTTKPKKISLGVFPSFLK